MGEEAGAGLGLGFQDRGGVSRGCYRARLLGHGGHQLQVRAFENELFLWELWRMGHPGLLLPLLQVDLLHRVRVLRWSEKL